MGEAEKLCPFFLNSSAGRWGKPWSRQANCATKIVYEIDVIGFIMGIWQKVIAAGIVAFIGWFYLWFRSRTFIKKVEHNRLKGIDADHQKCEPKYIKVKSEFDSLRELCAPYLEQKRQDFVRAQTGLISLNPEGTERPQPGEQRLSEALKPLKTNLYFDARKIPK